MRTYTLFKSFTATADAGATCTVVSKGTIVGVSWSVAGILNADAEFYHVELGTVPTCQGRTNDSQGAVSIVKAEAGLLTSGSVNGAANNYFPCRVPVDAGDKLYLHGVLTGTNSVDATCLIYVE